VARFKAFISYKHIASAGFAEALELAIKAYSKPVLRPPIAIFRDEKYLRPGVDLPSMIRHAIAESDYLIYLASPEAAISDWVKSELQQWCDDESRVERLIIVLTGGRISVDSETKEIVWSDTNAIPAVLANHLVRVPFYVDLSWATAATQQSVLNPDYKKAINLIVARLREVDPIELSGEEVLQHRRNVRLRNVALGIIMSLAVLLSYSTWFAWSQKLFADGQARDATKQKGIATAQASEANKQKAIAQTRELEAKVQTSIAEARARDIARQLADTWFGMSERISDEDPLAAFALATRAAETVPAGDPAEALYFNRVVHLLDELPSDIVNLPVQETVKEAIFNDAMDVVALVTEGEHLRIFDLKDGKALRVPDNVNEAGLSGSPSFVEHDTISAYVHWFNPEPDPDRSVTWSLHVRWNSRTGEVYSPIDDGSIPWEELELRAIDHTPGESLDQVEQSDVVITPPNSESLVVDGKSLPDRASFPQDRGQAKNKKWRLEANASGSILFWPSNTRKELLQVLRLDSVLDLKDAAFGPGQVVALDNEHALGAWNFLDGRNLWRRRLPSGTRLRVSPDHSLVHIEGGSSRGLASSEEDAHEALFRVNDGTRVSMPDSLISDQYDLLATSVTASGVVVYAFQYGWEAGDDLLFEWNHPQRSTPTSSCDLFPQEKPDHFLGFLVNGEYALFGSEHTFALRHLCSPSRQITMFFGSQSKLQANDAVQLLTDVIAIERSSNKRLRMRAESGAEFTLDSVDSAVSDVRSATGAFSLRSARNPNCTDGHALTLSPDGNWLASAAHQRLCIWDSRTGYTLTRVTSFEGEARDIEFSPDSRSVRLITSNGSVIKLLVAFHWTTRPSGLTAMGEAMSARLVADDGTTSPLSRRSIRALRARLGKQIELEDQDHPMTKLLKRRLSQSSRND
jgi:hypothetical protein